MLNSIIRMMGSGPVASMLKEKGPEFLRAMLAIIIAQVDVPEGEATAVLLFEGTRAGEETLLASVYTVDERKRPKKELGTLDLVEELRRLDLESIIKEAR